MLELSETIHAIAVAAGIVDYALPKGGAHAFWRRLSELHSARVSEAGPIALNEEWPYSSSLAKISSLLPQVLFGFG